jgi:glycosyltransferase involved in cell wall biosynthesis
LDIAIRAFHRIRLEAPAAEFHIYGAGDQLENLRRLIHELKLEDRVHLKKSTAMESISQFIENADLGLVPKRKDGFGNEAFSTKILEFMALGVPVLLADTLVDTYYFDESVAKFFASGDAENLAKALLELYENPQELNRLAQNATAFVQKFTWKEKQNLYLDLVTALTGRSAKRTQD